MEAEAIHDFVPKESGDNELPFKQGDKLLILNCGEDVHWYFAELNGRSGLVPGNYLRLEIPQWYAGRLTRTVAENMLIGNLNEGAFLVRLSESSPTNFSLSVKSGKSVQHFRVLKDNSSQYFLWSDRFRSLNELVKYYRTNSVSRTSQLFLRDMNEENQFVVEALYDFEAGDDNELPFKQGDLITVIDGSDENWWAGSNGHKKGFLPRSYVRPFAPFS